MKAMYLGVLLAACSILGACNSKSESAQPAAKPPVAVETQAAATAVLTDGIEVTGSLDPKFSVDVKTQIPGLVKQVFVTEWVRVRKGQPLARIDVAETEALVKRAEAVVEAARASRAQAAVAATRAERELARVLKLKESGLATQQAVDDARTESEAARTRIDAAQAQIVAAEEDVRQARARQNKGSVLSPIDGVVALRDVNVGDLASDAAAAKPIFRIVDNRLLNLTVTVPSADSARIKVGQAVDFTVDAHPGTQFSGKVKYINPELSSTDRSLKVIIEVPNMPEILKGGLFAKGRIVTGNRNNALLIPRSALGSFEPSARKGTLFVADNSIARQRQVTTGAIDGDQVEIKSGLKPGEHFVSRGGFNLKDGDRITVAGKR